MRATHRKTFEQILQDVAPRNARSLELKARWASWLAKVEINQSEALYEIKNDALRQLFRIPSQEPVIRDAWTSGRRYLLSVRLRRSRSLLHVPFDELRITTQQKHGMWVAQRAWGKRFTSGQISDRAARLAAIVAPTGFAA